MLFYGQDLISIIWTCHWLFGNKDYFVFFRSITASETNVSNLVHSISSKYAKWVLVLRSHFGALLTIDRHSLPVPVNLTTHLLRERNLVPPLHDTGTECGQISYRYENRSELVPVQHFVPVSCKRIQSYKWAPGWTRTGKKLVPVSCKHPSVGSITGRILLNSPFWENSRGPVLHFINELVTFNGCSSVSNFWLVNNPRKNLSCRGSYILAWGHGRQGQLLDYCACQHVFGLKSGFC